MAICWNIPLLAEQPPLVLGLVTALVLLSFIMRGSREAGRLGFMAALALTLPTMVHYAVAREIGSLVGLQVAGLLGTLAASINHGWAPSE